MKKIGLVFSGGGGKGAYEIGVWHALRKYILSDGTPLESRISAVSGTSVGALNAALFANHDLDIATTIWLNISDKLLLKPVAVKTFEATWTAVCELFEALQSDNSSLYKKIKSLFIKADENAKSFLLSIKKEITLSNLSIVSKKIFHGLPQLALLIFCTTIRIPLPIPTGFYSRHLAVSTIPSYAVYIYSIVHSLFKLGIPLVQIWPMCAHYLALFQTGVFSNDGLTSLILKGIPQRKLSNQSIPCIVTATNATILTPSSKKLLHNAIRKIQFCTSKTKKTTESYTNRIATQKLTEYFLLNKLEGEEFSNLLLASSAFPIVYPAILLDEICYIDGGIFDNTPLFPLVSYSNCSAIIAVHLENSPDIKSQTKNFPNLEVLNIIPSKPLGNLLEGTLNFSSKVALDNMLLGELDAIQTLETNQDFIKSWFC